MYNNNLLIDYKNEIRIPQNDAVYYEINEAQLYKESLEIKMKPFKDFDYFNLFLIIKSYSCNLIYVPRNFFIVVKNLNKSGFITYNANIVEFRNISYYGFIKWFNEQLQDDWRYMADEDSEYSYVFTYPLDIFNKKLINHLKPIYPWNKEIIEKLAKIQENERIYLKTIEEQHKEILKLNKIIDELRKAK